MFSLQRSEMSIATDALEEPRSARSEMYPAVSHPQEAKHIALHWSARLREYYPAINISPLRGEVVKQLLLHFQVEFANKNFEMIYGKFRLPFPDR
jgi:hypothetical protein